MQWNNIVLPFRPFDEYEQLKKNIAALKKNIFVEGQLDGYSVPTPKQRYDRKKHIAKLIDCVAQTLIGKHVFSILSSDTQFISCDLEKRKDVDILGNFIKEKNIINICPKTFCYPIYVQANVLIHEEIHAMHAQMEEKIKKRLGDKQDNILNLYDQFFLYFFDEFAACSNGQFAALCFRPKESKRVVDMRPLFFTPVYWNEYYTSCLEVLKKERNPLSFLTSNHTKQYYEIAREYFNLHPELRNAKIIHRIHEGWKIFAMDLKEELEKSSPQKISSQSIFVSFENKIPQLVDRAINIKF